MNFFKFNLPNLLALPIQLQTARHKFVFNKNTKSLQKRKRFDFSLADGTRVRDLVTLTIPKERFLLERAPRAPAWMWEWPHVSVACECFCLHCLVHFVNFSSSFGLFWISKVLAWVEYHHQTPWRDMGNIALNPLLRAMVNAAFVEWKYRRRTK